MSEKPEAPSSTQVIKEEGGLITMEQCILLCELLEQEQDDLRGVRTALRRIEDRHRTLLTRLTSLRERGISTSPTTGL